MRARGRRFWTLVIATALFVYPAALVGFQVVYGLNQVAPRDPWDSAMIVEGWRVATGLPIYDFGLSGHATTMYGFAEPLVIGAIFHLFGPSNLAVQTLTLLSVSVVALTCAVTMRKLLGPAVLLLVLSVIGLDMIASYYVSGRPDMAAWAIGFIGLCLMYKAGTSVLRWTLSGLVLLIAVSFKQTAGMLALVPPAAVLAELLINRTFRNLASVRALEPVFS